MSIYNYFYLFICIYENADSFYARYIYVCAHMCICLRNKNDKFEIANIYIYSKSAVHKMVEAFGFKFSLT